MGIRRAGFFFPEVLFSMQEVPHVQVQENARPPHSASREPAPEVRLASGAHPQAARRPHWALNAWEREVGPGLTAENHAAVLLAMERLDPRAFRRPPVSDAGGGVLGDYGENRLGYYTDARYMP